MDEPFMHTMGAPAAPSTTVGQQGGFNLQALLAAIQNGALNPARMMEQFRAFATDPTGQIAPPNYMGMEHMQGPMWDQVGQMNPRAIEFRNRALNENAMQRQARQAFIQDRLAQRMGMQQALEAPPEQAPQPNAAPAMPGPQNAPVAGTGMQPAHPPKTAGEARRTQLV